MDIKKTKATFMLTLFSPTETSFLIFLEVLSNLISRSVTMLPAKIFSCQVKEIRPA